MTPWNGDACSLVDAFRAGSRSPVDELKAVLDAIERSELNAFSHLDVDGARERAAEADVSLPFGGVPIGIKDFDAVQGWPFPEGSLVFADRVATYTSTMVERLMAAGVVPVGQTTVPEFSGMNSSVSKIYGTTRNPWNPTKTPGGSSSGSAAAVAGGLLPIATAADGGGSIRIPAGFCGLVGLKGTAGRIPRGPHVAIGPLTDVKGCVARSVRDAARWLDVCCGFDAHDPYSLPRVEGWEAGLGSYVASLAGKRVAIAPTLGAAIVRPEVEERVVAAAEALARDCGLKIVDVPVKLPGMSLEWVLSNIATVRADLGDRWPACKDDLTLSIAFGLEAADRMVSFNTQAAYERSRTAANEAMAQLFDEVDFVICATNPDVAFPADVETNNRVGDLKVGPENNGALTIPANVSGNPAISIPAGTFDGLPVGMQVIGRHHEDALLLDLALVVERERPWPLVAPGSARG